MDTTLLVVILVLTVLNFAFYFLVYCKGSKENRGNSFQREQEVRWVYPRINNFYALCIFVLYSCFYCSFCQFPFAYGWMGFLFPCRWHYQWKKKHLGLLQNKTYVGMMGASTKLVPPWAWGMPTDRTVCLAFCYMFHILILVEFTIWTGVWASAESKNVPN